MHKKTRAQKSPVAPRADIVAPDPPSPGGPQGRKWPKPRISAFLRRANHRVGGSNCFSFSEVGYVTEIRLITPPKQRREPLPPAPTLDFPRPLDFASPGPSDRTVPAASRWRRWPVPVTEAEGAGVCRRIRHSERRHRCIRGSDASGPQCHQAPHEHRCGPPGRGYSHFVSLPTAGGDGALLLDV